MAKTVRLWNKVNKTQRMAEKKNENVEICAGWWLAVLSWMILLPSQKGELSKEAKNARIADSFQVTLGLSVTNNPQYHQLSFSNNRKYLHIPLVECGLSSKKI